MTVALGRVAEVNPPVPEFSNEADSPVTFVPLECVWPDGRADFTRTRPANEVSTGYTLFRRGDVLVPKITPTFESGRVAVANIPTKVGAGTTELHIVRPRSGVDARFLAYVLRSQPFLQDGATRLQGVGNLRRVPAEFLAKFPVAISDPQQQRAIADYLDRETAQIDTLIEEQQRLLVLTEERRVAVAEDILGGCVGGPQRLRWFISDVDQRAGEAAPELPLLSVSISWGVRRREDVSDDLPRAEDLSAYKVCRRGDIVLNRMRAFQGALGVAKEDGVVSPDYAVLRCSEALDARWLGSVMRTRAFVAEMAKRIRGIGSASLGNARTPRINVNDLKEIGLSISSPSEQESQLEQLTRATGSIDELRASAQDLVSLALERRAALITAAVTGQIDVGTAA